MNIFTKSVRQRPFCLMILLLNEILSCCSGAVSPALPPENYNGPRAEQPLLQSGDFWIYETGNGTRAKSTKLQANLAFPLWIGKTWSYETEVRKSNLPPAATPSPGRGRVDCLVKSIDELTVHAGKFSAFRCECLCELLTGVGQYLPGCGAWTIWYSPDAKNVVQTKTASTSSS